MAAAIKAVNAKIRSNKVLDYFCSTHFWGPASNFGIPLAAVMDTAKDPEIISGKFTATLIMYSAVFMRYSMAVTPKNYLLFGCHFVNFNSQIVQEYRWYDYWYGDGSTKQKWEKLREETKAAAGNAADKIEGAAADAKSKAAEVKNKVS